MLSPGLVDDINVALNESDLLDVGVDPDSRLATVTLRVLTLTREGQEPANRVVHLMLHDVWRVVASLRAGRWDDMDAQVERFALQELSTVVRSFGGLPIYGWEFVDPTDDLGWSGWRDRLSVDVALAEPVDGHVLEVFQAGDGPDRHLDIRIWFGSLSVSTGTQADVDVAEFAAGGVRWWDAMYAGDPAAQGHGIVPAGPPMPVSSAGSKPRVWPGFLGRRARGQ